MEQLAEAELLFVAVPSAHVRPLAESLGRHLDGSHLLVHVSRGLLGEDLQTLTQLLRERTPCRRVGALAGPLLASALAEGSPGAATVGSVFPEIPDAVRDAIACPSMRIYHTDDVIGVEVASAMVGVVALAVAYAQGLGLGPPTLAMIATRGMFEAARIGATLGARRRTFSGLAGMGDLISAVANDGRPELLLGRAMAEGKSMEEAAKEAAAHVEGTRIARCVVDYAERMCVDVPVSAAVADVLDGSLDGKAAVARLMARPSRAE
jgi:glycerol-3-phosphate dehydrogenase (NAD(P)+)